LCGTTCMATRALQGKLGPVLFRHLFIFALLCGQTCCPSLQVWCCACVYSEINPSCLFGGVGGPLPKAMVTLAAASPALRAGSSRSCCLAKAVGLQSLPPAEVLRSCSPGVFLSDGIPPAIPPSVQMWDENKGEVIIVSHRPPFLYLKLQSSRSRTTLLVPAAFTFSSHPFFNFTLSPALCLQAICVL